MRDVMIDSLCIRIDDHDDRSQHGTGMSSSGTGGKKGEYKRFIQELARIADQSGNSRFTTDNLYQVARGMSSLSSPSL